MLPALNVGKDDWPPDVVQRTRRPIITAHHNTFQTCRLRLKNVSSFRVAVEVLFIYTEEFFDIRFWEAPWRCLADEQEVLQTLVDGSLVSQALFSLNTKNWC